MNEQRQSVPDWIRSGWTWIIGGVLLLVAQWAITQERTARNETAYATLSMRLTTAEQNWQESRDRVLQHANDLQVLRTESAAIQDDVRDLQEADRATDKWQATIDERMSNMLAQLARIASLLERRLPDMTPQKSR